MLSVTQSAELLGISSSRIRALIAKGILPAVKVGNSWCIEEKDILQRAMDRKKAGRPTGVADGLDCFSDDEDADAGDLRKMASKYHEAYLECKEYFSSRPNGQILQSAETSEEASFYMAVSDFFLQQKQRHLVAEGVY